MFMPMLNGNWFGWGLLGAILHMILWGAFILGVAYFVIRMVKGAGGDDPKNNALDILKRRYAAGEISEEDYDRMKDKVR